MKSNRMICILGAVVLMMLTVACNKERTLLWGETEYYTDFLFKKYEPVKMTRTLEVSFNEDALRYGATRAQFALLEQIGDNRHPAQNVRLYKNGSLCPNNILEIDFEDREVEVSLEFLPDAAEGNHAYVLWLKEGSGLDRVDYTELESGFYVRKVDIANPLAKGVLIGLLAILLLLAVIWTICRMNHPSLRFSKIYIDYDGSGEIVYPVSGYQVVLTDKPYPVGFWHKVFCGNVVVIRHEFWSEEIRITGRNAQELRIYGGYEIEIDTDEPMRQEPITFKHDGHKAELTTN